MSSYFDERPLYFEENGQLFVYVNQTTSAGIPFPWDSYDVEIKDYSDTECKFGIKVDLEGDSSTEINNEYIFEAVNIDGWKLKTVVKDSILR